ncbi:hypothetical protein CR513_17942, partial [Mucuna pruriens]
MIAFFNTYHIDMWGIVVNGNYIPIRENNVDFPCASKIDVHKISCKYSKEVWDILVLAYEVISQVKDSKINMLVHQYELFKMEEHEIIDLMFE